MKTLTGHTSKETARVVDDYPYGYRLRCKIRYWLEYRPSFGFRLVSQTTNPKKPGEFWNKPKPSTYSAVAVMVETEEGHIEQRALRLYPSLQEAEAFEAQHGDTLDSHAYEITHACTNEDCDSDHNLSGDAYHCESCRMALTPGTRLDFIVNVARKHAEMRASTVGAPNIQPSKQFPTATGVTPRPTTATRPIRRKAHCSITSTKPPNREQVSRSPTTCRRSTASWTASSTRPS